MEALLIAQICHEANRAYCETLGDNSQPHWEDAPAWQRDSAINGVQFHLAKPGQPPSRSHEEWFKQKEAEGWKFGPVKNPAIKQHPCMVPYDQLPIQQRRKDAIFIALIEALRDE